MGAKKNSVTYKTYTATFIDKSVNVGDGEPKFIADKTGNSLDATRGVQFLQTNGDVLITSYDSYTSVTKVVLLVATNATSGMSIYVTVGSTDFLCGGESIIITPKLSSLTEYEFVCTGGADGSINVYLGAQQKSNSMYIKSISFVAADTSGSSSGSGSSEGGNSNVMSAQVYNPATFDNSRFDERCVDCNNAIGLPSTGTYNVLVVPIKFTDTSISSSQLTKLQKAFNGSTSDTGWQSVKSYYQTASYGALNMTFDIQSVFNAKYSSSYYDKSSGSSIILKEVLTYLAPKMDLSKYDTNNDGYIDGIYLIYSASVSYEEDSNYWAYVSWYQGNEKYDNLWAYYYLYAGFDFMDEDADSSDGFVVSGKIRGLSINASTYIHETGHMLGLDDYYDYAIGTGCDLGLGGADMMDYTVGDQNAYSKILLNWVTPTIVTFTTTLTISKFESSGDCILIPLDFDNSYFSEYLLIDLYSATGLNKMHASVSDSFLYGGASYGVRIYHVSSSTNNPYSSDYGSITDYDNSYTDKALIRLVEADGEYGFTSTDGLASDSDLWKSGKTFSNIYASYTRNDGKQINFDITITSVSSSSATITITF